jgi:PKD repeat protein
MRIKTKLFLLLVLNKLFVFNVIAGSVSGADITWNCVGQDSFIITLTIYKQCFGADLGSATLYLKDNSNSTVHTVQISEPQPIDITPNCDQSCNTCISSSCSFPYGFQKYMYVSSIVDLSIFGSRCEVNIEYSACCRNPQITNLASTGYSFYFHAMLNRCLSPCDNSPKFLEDPVLICSLGADYYHSNGAYDLDLDIFGELSDSLTYELISPKGTGATNLSYTSSYSYEKPLFFWGFPNSSLAFPRGFHLDSYTGEMMFRPMKQEVSVLVIRVNEYRNGQLIGYTTRDMILHVIPPQNQSLGLSGPTTKSVCQGDTVNFSISSSNMYNPTDTLTLFYDNALTGAHWTDNNGTTRIPSGTLKWAPGFDSYGKYKFSVMIRDDRCPLNSSSSKTYTVEVLKKPEVQYSVQKLSCGEYVFGIDSIIAQQSMQFQWSGTDNLSSKQKVFMHAYSKPGVYPFTLTCTSVNGCSQTYYDTIVTDTFLWSDLPSYTHVCYGDSLFLSPQIHDQKGVVSYQWSTGQQSAQITAGPIISDTMISLTITDSLCSNTQSIFIDVIDLPDFDLGNDLHLCNNDPYILKLNVTLDDSASNASCNWFKNDTSSLIGQNDSLLIADSALYICRVQDDLGCWSSDSVHVYLNPEIQAQISDQSVCDGDSLHLQAAGTGGGQALYSWYLDKNLLSTGQQFDFIPQKDTLYRLLIYEDSNGIRCSDTADFYIQILPLPDTSLADLQSTCSNVSLLHLPLIPNLDWMDQQGNTISSISPVDFGTGYHQIPFIYSSWKNGCQFQDSVPILINDFPGVDAGDDDTLCSGSGMHLLQGQPKGITGQWQGKALILSSGDYYFNTEDAQVSSGGTFELVYSFTDSNQCSNSDTLKMTLFNTPVPEAGSYPNLCSGDDPLLLQGSPVGGVWKGQGIQDSFFDPSIGRGLYEILYTCYSSGKYCPKTATAYIRVHPSPIVHFDADPKQGMAPLVVQFYQLSWINGGSIADYYWDLGDGSTSVLQTDFVHVYQNPGDYDVSLRLLSDKFCTSESEKPAFIRVSKNIGIEEKGDREVYIAPNPAKERTYIHIQSDDIELVVIYNALGREVQRMVIQGQGVYSLSKEELGAEGLYLLSFVSSGKEYLRIRLLLF